MGSGRYDPPLARSLSLPSLWFPAFRPIYTSVEIRDGGPFTLQSTASPPDSFHDDRTYSRHPDSLCDCFCCSLTHGRVSLPNQLLARSPCPSCQLHPRPRAICRCHSKPLHSSWWPPPMFSVHLFSFLTLLTFLTLRNPMWKVVRTPHIKDLNTYLPLCTQ